MALKARKMAFMKSLEETYNITFEGVFMHTGVGDWLKGIYGFNASHLGSLLVYLKPCVNITSGSVSLESSGRNLP